MELIRQRTDDQCAIAGITMATGLSYDYVLAMGEITKDYRTPGGTHTSCLLTKLGVCHEIVYNSQSTISNQVIKKMLWGRRALLSVASLNRDNAHHIIYWHYDKVLDPQNGNEFDGVVKKYFEDITNNMEIDTVYLICEGPSCKVKQEWKIEKIGENS